MTAILDSYARPEAWFHLEGNACSAMAPFKEAQEMAWVMKTIQFPVQKPYSLTEVGRACLC